MTGVADAEPALAPPTLQLLGAFRARTGRALLVFPSSVQRGLAYLALHGATSRKQVAAALWPDQEATRAASDLRTLLWRLQHVSPDFVAVDGSVLELHDRVRVDVDVVTAWALESISPGAVSLVERVVTPRGAGRDLLPGWDEPWLDLHRTRLQMLQAQAYEAVTSRLLAAGRVAEALPFALHVIEQDPLRESAQQLMIEIHLRQGNVAQALAQYERYRVLLERELGIAPGLRVTTLIGQYSARPAPRRTAPH
ncbi:SARP family transcriptional regulator [Cellulomonas sp. Sa3CUA2]|uniref:SARP family transcriptional regulator n=1 Tax=Cellulomonas avistercoris TaxID=2762242 RepID=A0ABR8QBP8_9CELL|nr:BTAD domain-containing putative transcriptional regulator [Cellulomonas avistercoris]MBD7917853.1 SARP family transcriptional regulator [Cellulomonas avistercoris]